MSLLLHAALTSKNSVSLKIRRIPRNLEFEDYQRRDKYPGRCWIPCFTQPEKPRTIRAAMTAFFFRYSYRNVQTCPDPTNKTNFCPVPNEINQFLQKNRSRPVAFHPIPTINFSSRSRYDKKSRFQKSHLSS